MWRRTKRFIWWRGKKAFKDCKKLSELNIPNTLEEIGSNAFEGDGLLAGLLGFGVYINGLSDYEQTVYLGDVDFIKNEEKKLNN